MSTVTEQRDQRQQRERRTRAVTSEVTSRSFAWRPPSTSRARTQLASTNSTTPPMTPAIQLIVAGAHAEEHGDAEGDHERDGEDHPRGPRGQLARRERVGDGARAGFDGRHQLAPENALRRLTTARAIELTTKRDDEEDEAGRDEHVDVDAVRLGEVERDVGGDRRRVLRAGEHEADDERGREHHRDDHRLAEGAAEAEHRRPRRCRGGRTAAPPSGSSPSGSRRGRAPPPRAASGVCRKISRQRAVMIGRIMTASTIATVRMVRPVPETGGAKSGIQPRFSTSQS